jgi:hypothetical protein
MHVISYLVRGSSHKKRAPRPPVGGTHIRLCRTRVLTATTPMDPRTSWLELLDDAVLVYLLLQGGLSCVVKATRLNHWTNRLCSVEIQSRLPHFRELTGSPFGIRLAQSFGIDPCHTLDLANNHLTSRHVSSFSLAISNGALASLKRLYINVHKAGADSIKDLSTALSSGTLTRLKILIISGSKIDDVVMSVFVGVWPRLNMTRLCLPNNRIGEIGMKMFSGAIATGALANLAELCLYGNKIDNKGMGFFCTALASAPLTKLTHFDIGMNLISDEGMGAFSTAIGTGCLKNLIELDMDNNKIGDRGMRHFSTAVSNGALAKLTDLGLDENQIGDKGMRDLSFAIESDGLKSLYHLSVPEGPYGDKHPTLCLACKNRAINLI